MTDTYLHRDLHTAGWFVEHTALPDSEVLEPLTGERADYGIINHASWPHWRTFLPQLILLPSFRRFVLATFAANGVAAQPILYRLEGRHSRTDTATKACHGHENLDAGRA
jgi:hypothetical protein